MNSSRLALAGGLVFTMLAQPVCATIVVPEAHWAVYSEGVKQEKLGNLRQAVTNYSTALEIEKTDTDTLIKLGLMYLHSDTIDPNLRVTSVKKAIEYLSKANIQRPGDAMINLLLGQANESLGDYDQSISYYQKAITVEPANVLLKLNLGLIFYQTKNYKQAIELLNKVVMAYPENLKARSYLGAALQATDNYIAAIEQYNYVLEFEKTHYSIIKNTADSWLALEQLDKAKEFYTQAKTLDPKVPNIYADLAYIATKEKNYPAAIDYYRQALKLKDDEKWRKALAYTLWANDSLEEAVLKFEEIEDYSIAGYLHQVLGNTDKAIASYKKAIDKDPKDTKSQFNLARIYHDARKHQEAKDLYLKVLEYKPNDVDVLFLLGVAEHESGALDQAIKYYNDVLTSEEGLPNKDPDVTAKTQFNLALAYKSQNQLVKAEQLLEKVAIQDRSFEKSGDVYKELSFIKIALNKHNEAEKVISEWLRENPTNIEARNLYADYLIYKSKDRQAIEQLRLAATLDKGSTTRLKLANLLHSQNSYYEALAEYQTILQKEPEHLGAILGAANNFKALGLNSEAKELYKKALEKYPDDLLANYNYGLLLQADNKIEEALAQYKKVEGINPNFTENYYVMGLCYWDLGEKIAAIDIWKKFLTSSNDETLRQEIFKRIGATT